MQRHTASALALVAALGAPAAPAQSTVDEGPEERPGAEPAFPAQTNAPAMRSGAAPATATVAGGLVHPWGLAVLPGDRGYLVTERPGRLRHISENGTASAPIAGVPDVFAEEQGGLLDVTLGPDFAETRRVYLTYAKPMGGGTSGTAAARATLSADRTELTGVQEIFAQQPPSPTPMHYGSRLVLDGAGHVFITTGEHFTERERRLAQDMDTTYGKIVRLTPSGAVPDDNPFADAGTPQAQIWTRGHRNVQGAAMRPGTDEFWAIEHGPQGGDELNLIEPGANYGWPEVSYGENYDGTPVTGGDYRHAEAGFTPPRYYWDPVIAPGDMTFYDGSMFAEWQGDILAAGLVSGGLVRLSLDGDTVTGEERLVSGLGRVRDVDVDQDGSVLALTDYADGRLVRLAADRASN
jgi:glucose/arabinose dehydrogenase